MPRKTAQSQLDAAPNKLQFDDFVLDLDLRELSRNGERIKLPAKPFATLEFLVENRQRVVPKAELLDKVWCSRQETNTVEQAVRKARKALGDNAAVPRYIETIPGAGYRFIADVNGSAPTETEAPGDTAPTRRRLLIATGAGAPFVCLAGFFGLRQHNRPQVARVVVDGANVVALNAVGSALWTYKFDQRLQPPTPEEAVWQVQIADLNGDGIPEVLVTPAFASNPTGPREMICLSSTGRQLWLYRPQARIRFSRPDLNGPWKLLHVVIPQAKPPTIWAAVAHDIWWPSFVVRISAIGANELAFVNSGAVYRLQEFSSATEAYMLAAGVNNEYRGGALAVVSVNGPPATSPQTLGSAYRCLDGCPHALPYRYILFPRSELNIAGQFTYNQAMAIHVRPDHITIGTRETDRAVMGFWDFSPDFIPQRVTYSDNYRDEHERFEREGRIDHPYKDCPERKTGAAVQIWDEAGNRRTVTVPRVRPYE